jgi:hypothetical protein
MGAINVKHTGSGAAIALSSDGTSLLLDGTAIGGGGGGGGALEFVSKTTISSSVSSITLSGLTAYKNYYVVYNIEGGTTGTRLYAKLSEDNGSTFKTSGCSQTFQKAAVTSMTVGNKANNGSTMSLDGSGSVARSFNGIALIQNGGETSDFSVLFDLSMNISDTKRYMIKTVVGVETQTTAINAVNLFTNYNYFEAGEILLYGVKDS